MKKIFAIGLFLIAGVALGQDTQKGDDAGLISLATVVPQNIDGMPAQARTSLNNKLKQIVNKSGLGGNPIFERFILVANVELSTKDITPTAPPMHAYTVNVNLYIGDGIDGTLFSSTSIPLKGVGETETKAYLAALKNLKVDDARYKSFIEEGKNKIIDYYNKRCDNILKEADVLKGQSKFDEAIALLVSVPEACADCYSKALAAVQPIYQLKIDYQCKIDLAAAKNAWNANLSWDGAQEAATYLGNIDPNSSCFQESQKFSQEIAKRIKEVDKREWDFKTSIAKDRIKAIRDIGVAYGNGQPKTISYNYVGWWR